jgi:hypothetical protein
MGLDAVPKEDQRIQQGAKGGQVMKVIISCHDGKEFETDVRSFDAEAVNKELNDSSKTNIAIGDVSLHKSKIASVYKASSLKKSRK